MTRSATTPPSDAPSSGSEAARDRDALRASRATAVGNAMEWFDFGIYSYLLVVLSEVFFPEGRGQGMLFGFGTFAIAFLVRPIGGLVFGPLGDRIGRKGVLATTLVMMACATFSIGLIPSYERIGVGAPALLLLARLLQGFSTGGEYSGASTFITESAPDTRRGHVASLLEVGTLTGLVGAALLVLGLTLALGDETMRAWGWRVPFLLAGPLGLVGLYLRNRVAETPAFLALEAASEARSARSKITLVLATHTRAVVLAMMLVLALNVTNYLVLAYMPSYLASRLGYSSTQSIGLSVVMMTAMLLVIPSVGRLSDRVGRRPVLAAACLGYLLSALPALWLVRQGTTPSILAGLSLLGGCQVLFLGTTPSALPAMFPTAVRYSGMAISYNVSVSLFGGTAPLVVELLIDYTGNPSIPAYYAMGAALIGLVAVACMEETSGKPIDDAPTSLPTRP